MGPRVTGLIVGAAFGANLAIALRAVGFVDNLAVLFLGHRMRHHGLIADILVRRATANDAVDRDRLEARRAVIMAGGVGIHLRLRRSRGGSLRQSDDKAESSGHEHSIELKHGVGPLCGLSQFCRGGGVCPVVFGVNRP